MYYPFFIFEGLNIVKSVIIEDLERQIIFEKAKNEADRLGLPLVNYGCKGMDPYISESDLNLDIVPRNVPNFMLIEPDGKIPLPDNSAVIYASHVLEHVNNPTKVLKEMQRVGPTYIVLPKWDNIINWIHPEHKRIFTVNGEVNNPSSFSLPLFTGLNLLALAI